ncbi:PepSY domain-containing protein [Rhodocyclaceae bacterium SMB388]
MKASKYLPVLALVAALVGAMPAVGVAGDRDDHERARRALEAGEVLPLGTVLARVERDFPGQVIEVELERDDGMWLYEVKLIRSGGALVELEIDARNGDVLRIKGRDTRPSAPRGKGD